MLKDILPPYCLRPASPDKSCLSPTQIDHIAKIKTAENEKILFIFFDDRLDLIENVLKNVAI